MILIINRRSSTTTSKGARWFQLLPLCRVLCFFFWRRSDHSLGSWGSLELGLAMLDERFLFRLKCQTSFACINQIVWFNRLWKRYRFWCEPVVSKYYETFITRDFFNTWFNEDLTLRHMTFKHLSLTWYLKYCVIIKYAGTYFSANLVKLDYRINSPVIEGEIRRYRIILPNGIDLYKNLDLGSTYPPH